MAPKPNSAATVSCLLLVEGADAPARQMAVDEILLESAASQGRPTLRFYAWSEPTLSLGYFQRDAERSAHPPSRDCVCVRRLTGGGAILHDRELTYSLTLPQAHPLARDAARLYEVADDALVRALQPLGIDARRREVVDERPARSQPFLCFQRRAAGDVLIGQSKVCGSAQRRRRGAILQHGSLLLACSRHAPELPGVEELTGRPQDAGEIAGRWGRELAAALGFSLDPGQISAEAWQAADQLARRKYGSPLWNQRR